MRTDPDGVKSYNDPGRFFPQVLGCLQECRDQGVELMARATLLSSVFVIAISSIAPTSAQTPTLGSDLSEDADAIYEKAEALSRQGKFEDAARYFDKVIQL